MTQELNPGVLIPCIADRLSTTEPLGKPMTNLDSILKSRDITLVTQVCRVKTMVFPVIM